ncbi:hypothetical protein G5C60_35990 [Streptomyces sp. HC44]|uniref:Polyisoprenoid-binding protein n=1 Tax=Streptomyces scabichelini TaxID=2711217 RepID=A0A6G4VGG1_9ACTN|nr:hypothetical protein [Streptomyces scabichelini]NGO12863.1 hypothetical protein [Streptomyces scabichelini]
MNTARMLATATALTAALALPVLGASAAHAQTLNTSTFFELTGNHVAFNNKDEFRGLVNADHETNFSADIPSLDGVVGDRRR